MIWTCCCLLRTCALSARCALTSWAERPGVFAMGAGQGGGGRSCVGDLLQYRRSSRGWLYIYDLAKRFPGAETAEDRRLLQNFTGFDEMLDLFEEISGAAKPAPMPARWSILRRFCTTKS